jgi:beta-glucosidase
MKADSTIAEDRPILKFPDDFLWGVGVSAYQNEGNTPSTQWGEFEDAGGTVTGEKCGRAADWWRNAEQDFDRARDLGVKSLRMGVSWARIEPEEGRFDERAILRYREMLEGLLQRGIRPMICLHHFAHPLWFERSGAFTSRKSPEQFLSFARHTVRKLGDLCQDWLTVNEPNVFANLSYVLGEHPPGKRGRTVVGYGD